jgi:Spy/CpxP family protein refolding chaperone
MRQALAAAVVWVAMVVASPVQAQMPAQGAAPAAPPGAAPGVTPGEIQRLFDAYAIMQAQQQLQLTDEQFARFVTKMKGLQEVRRSYQQDRIHAIQDLRRLAQQGDAADDAQIKDRLKALDDIDARNCDDLRKAYAAIDSVLTVRQQARFRVFEEQLERRKIELLTRARAAARRPQ